MSADNDVHRVFSEQSSSDDSNFPSSKSKINVGKPIHREKSATPPELTRNEAAARSKPGQRSSGKNPDDADEAGQTVEEDDDPCAKKKIDKPVVAKKLRRTPGPDPRFQQTNQTLRCFVMYTDFYRCEKILGEGHEACTWFHDVFTSICPNAWIERWDELRSKNLMPWSRSRTQGDFPGDRYGV